MIGKEAPNPPFLVKPFPRYKVNKLGLTIKEWDLMHSLASPGYTYH